MSDLNILDSCKVVRQRGTTTVILCFKIVNQNKANYSIPLTKFWKMLFSIYDIVSIQIIENSINIYLGYIIKSNVNIEKVIIEEISKIKTLAVKSLPAEQELILTKNALSNLDKLIEKESYFYNPNIGQFYHLISFSQIELNSNFKQTFMGFLEIPNLQMNISSEKSKNMNIYTFSIIINSDNLIELKRKEERLISYLKLNPTIKGKLEVTNSKEYINAPGRFMLGLTRNNISNTVIYEILKPMGNILVKQQIITEPKNIYPWLGFKSAFEEIASPPIAKVEKIKKNNKPELTHSEKNNHLGNSDCDFANRLFDLLSKYKNFIIQGNEMYTTLGKYSIKIIAYETLPKSYIDEKASYNNMKSNTLVFVITNKIDHLNYWKKLNIDIVLFDDIVDNLQEIGINFELMVH